MHRVVRPPYRFAFTLIELLVVIAIIALLVSIMLPSLGEARRSARLVVCETNHRTLMQASAFYSSESGGPMPFPNWGGGRRQPGWAYTLDSDHDNIGDYTEQQRRELPKTGQLWPYIQGLDVYHCPEDTSGWPENQTSRWISSYSMNGALCGYGKLKGGGSDLLLTYNASDFRGDAIILWEVDDTSGWWNDCANYPKEGVTKRHRTGATVGMICGATEWVSYSEFYEEEQRRPGRLWCNPGRPDGR